MSVRVYLYILCMFLSDSLFTRSFIICLSVRPTVRLFACFCARLYGTLLISLFAHGSSVRSSVRLSSPFVCI